MRKAPKAKPIKTSKGFRLQANYKGQQYKRFLISNQNKANKLQDQVNQRIAALKYGILKIPSGVSIADFLFSNIEGSSSPQPFQKTYLAKTSQKPFLSLSHLIDKFTEISVPEKPESSQKTILIHIRHLQKFITSKKYADPPLEDIDVPFFDEYKFYRKKKKVSNDTINKELVTFQSMFKLAKTYGYVKENILLKVERYKRKKFIDRFRTIEEAEKIIQLGGYSEDEIKKIKRYRYLTESHIENFIKLAEGHWLHPILIVLAYTGIRRGELMQLEWQDVDLENKVLWVKSKKQSRTYESIDRGIPMHEKVQKVLQKQQKTRKNRWVFPGPDGQMLKKDRMKALRRLLKGSIYEGLGYHALRHSFASLLAAKKVDGRVIDRLMGHQSGGEIRRHYEHLDGEKMNEAVTLL